MFAYVRCGSLAGGFVILGRMAEALVREPVQGGLFNDNELRDISGGLGINLREAG